MAKTEDGKSERIVIQKYANRRLYNKATSTYITLDNLAEMVREGADFVVYDAKSGEDITRKVLTQIIFEEENSSDGKNLLPIQFLRQLIGFYGGQMQAFLPAYLELSLDAFAKSQEKMRAQFGGAGPAKFPGLAGGYEEQIRQNMQMFDRAMKMFTPFGFPGQGEDAPASETVETPEAEARPSPADPALDELKAQLAAMQAQIAKLAEKG